MCAVSLGSGTVSAETVEARLRTDSPLGVVAFYFPKIYAEYAANMDTLLDHHKDLKRPIPNTVFAATSFNFGPNSTSYEHADHGNKANGLCPIFATGNFDPAKGGHIVLRQLMLIIRFPPGSLCVIPSATLRHGNAAIQNGEERESFTQYASGGLFRWVEYGFQTWPSVLEDPELLEREMARRETRCQESIDQFSHIDSLHEDRAMYLV